LRAEVFYFFNWRLLDSPGPQIFWRLIGRVASGAGFWGSIPAEGPPMREWLLVLLPIALIVYFVVYPARLIELMAWIGRLFH
jgi:hypothetical protein